MTEYSLFAITVSCHPELVSGSALLKTVAGGSGLVASRSEVMLPPAGSEARWCEEVMLALAHQEAKTKEKERAN